MTITDEKGAVVVDWKNYGALLSSRLSPKEDVRELKPGEIVTNPLGLTAALELADEKPGRYFGKVTYSYGGFVAESEVVEFEYKK